MQPSETITQAQIDRSHLGSVIRNHITAYTFLLPAVLLILIFGIFPVIFAFFVSLHRWQRFPDGFRGLDQYVDALGNFAYVLFIWIAIGFAVYGTLRLRDLWQESKLAQRISFIMAVPFVMLITSFVYWFFILLPIILSIPQRLLRQQITQQLFLREFAASFAFPEVVSAAHLILIAFLIVVLTVLIGVRLFNTFNTGEWIQPTINATLAFSAWVISLFFFWLTITEINQAMLEAVESGEMLPIWTQVIVISLGALAMVTAYYLWRLTTSSDNNATFFVRSLIVVCLIVAAYALIVELPQSFSNADDDMLQGFSVTVMFSLFSVPLQLILGLGGAVLLFSKIKAKSFFRMVYFLPYVTPFAATSVIFSLIFSHRDASPINQIIGLVGINPQNWLLEPHGIFHLIFGADLPDWLAGPSLALIVIILYNVWVYAGYSSVIFLAGLGNIPKELYEAARIDGANSWRQFRHITLPLLSPTTFFLMLIATIGTFQAFTQIFLLRRSGAYAAVDTINLYIYEEIKNNPPDFAYGSALAFVLFGVILALTLIQNRIVGRRVFYG